MPIQTDADLDFMLEDAGVPVSLGAARTFGIFRRDDSLVNDPSGSVNQVSQQVLTIRDGTLPGLVEEAHITIAGAVYRVRTILPPTTRLVRIAVA